MGYIRVPQFFLLPNMLLGPSSECFYLSYHTLKLKISTIYIYIYIYTQKYIHTYIY